ncbi:MAG: DUF839 domain-containing protein [Planctomycetes bacterium]|nr:DUF839 domain-containing protein [Planctomycetota bacterium]
MPKLLSITLTALASVAAAVEPYIVPTLPGVSLTPIATVGDSFNAKADGSPYRFVGIPDGLGAYSAGRDGFVLLMNHELAAGTGVVRAHGQNGGFVSRWSIKRGSLAVERIEDFNPAPGTIHSWSAATGHVANASMVYRRLCSADLAMQTAFVNPFTGKGTWSHMLLSGEETGPEGRAFAHVATGASARMSYELPHLGKCSWENLVANPFPQDRTVVIGTDDATPGQLYVYVGDKRHAGSDVERSGLVGGRVFGVSVPHAPLEIRETGVGAGKGVPVAFTMAALGDLSASTGAQIQTLSQAMGVTEFLRPEDGAWDPLFPRDFYFVTTDRFDQVKDGLVGGQIGRSRLWRLRFADITDPAAGGTITMLIDGSELPGPQMMDNLSVDWKGRVLLQEDPGNQKHLARIWMYEIETGELTEIAKHNPALFGDMLVPGTLTNDEESSGIIDASAILGGNMYLFDVQAHYDIAGELVQGGQLLAMRVPRGGMPPILRVLWRFFAEPRGIAGLPAHRGGGDLAAR